MAPLKIPNRLARWLWLDAQQLSTPPTGPLDVLGIIRALGFVQLDTIQTVTRAHHHILWSRNQNYREPMLDKLIGKERSVFEHFTHDASVIPMDFLPMWQRRIQRMAEHLHRTGWFRDRPDEAICNEIITRIRAEGPLSTHAFDTKIEGPKEMWARPPHKRALDYMWFTGTLATCHRVNFTKYYDLPERVFPDPYSTQAFSDDEQIDWLCRAALDRWDGVETRYVREWIAEANDLREIEIESAKGPWMNAFAHADIETRLEELRKPTSRLRILNPFDPAVRDRNRLVNLFGFEYRNEMFVPAAKRVWGYYVFPILEGDRFVGRIEIKADRKAGRLNVLQFWSENGLKWPESRQHKLTAALDRLARFVGVEDVFRLDQKTQ